MLVGGSAGLNLHAAVEISKTAKPGSVIVAILADNGVKYLTKIYNNDWIKAKVCHCLVHCWLADVQPLCKVIGYLCVLLHQLQMFLSVGADIATNMRQSVHSVTHVWQLQCACLCQIERGAAATDMALVHILLESRQYSHMIARNVFVAEF